MFSRMQYSLCCCRLINIILKLQKILSTMFLFLFSPSVCTFVFFCDWVCFVFCFVCVFNLLASIPCSYHAMTWILIKNNFAFAILSGYEMSAGSFIFIVVIIIFFAENRMMMHKTNRRKKWKLTRILCRYNNLVKNDLMYLIFFVVNTQKLNVVLFNKLFELNSEICVIFVFSK